jgi:hypothetical protein
MTIFIASRSPCVLARPEKPSSDAAHFELLNDIFTKLNASTS